MWISYNDKYEIVRWRLTPHDEKKRPRKFRYTSIRIKAGGIAVVLAGLTLFAAFMSDFNLYCLLPLLGICVLFLTVVAILKWRRNNKELDIGLLLLLITIVATTLLVWRTSIHNAERRSEIEMKYLKISKTHHRSTTKS